MVLITELLTSASPLEALYIIRTLMNDLRIGIQESTIREAMTSAFFNGDKRASEIIQDALNKSNDLGAIFEIAQSKKLEGFKKIKLEIGKPVKVMLAQKAKDVIEGFDAVGKPCAIEYKYDGFRLVIHKDKEKITLFTRRLENVTKQFPEVVDYIKEYVKGESFILDSEAVGFDKKTHEYKPFQEISQRIKRKYDIDKIRNELPVEINVFDILLYEGKSMLEEPFSKRTEFLKKIISNHPFKIIYSKQIITSDEKEAQDFYEQALRNNQEGVMMKNLQSPYNPGSRVGHMLKVKPDERDLDLVITGGEFGTGKRSGWISSFTLSCSDGENFLEVGKVGTGFKEKKEEGVSFEELTEKVKPLIISENGKDVKIKPEIVVAITYQEIQQSPTYSSGFALRFPRFTSLRIDKPLSEITSLSEIKKEFEKQKRI
jgi:DNA ligase-1